MNYGARRESCGWSAPAGRALRISAAAMTMLFLSGMPASASAPSDADESCPVVAAAAGVQVMVSASDNLALQAPTGAASPMAQSCVDFGVADSAGFAGNPYPGETVIAAPAIVGGATEQSVPEYPAYAASRYPSAEESKIEQQGYSLSSQSTETSSEARAHSGAEQDGAGAGSLLATASAVVDPDAKTASASATSDSRPVAINEVLELGRVRSTATAKVRADGKITRASTLTVGRTAVAGQVGEITPDGIRVAGQAAPLPEVDPVEQLESAGVRVRYLAAVKTARGVLSAGIEVTAHHTDPDTGAAYTARYTFGRAYAAVAPMEARERGAAPAAPVVPGTGSGPPSGPVPAGAAPMGKDPVASGPAPAAVPEAPTAEPSELAPPVAAPTRLLGTPVDMGMAGLYLVLAFGALALFVGGMLLRVLGVRTRWTA